MNIVSLLIRPIPLRTNKQIIALVTLFISSFVSYALEPLPNDLHGWALSAIDLVYKEEFRQAEEEARKIVKKYPDHPAGYFFMAVVLESWMSLYQSDKKENEFYRFCDLAIEKSEKLLAKDPRNQWARFFMGGADGYKGTYEARYERWITAFRYGWKGVSTLLALESEGCAIADIHYGIGSYDYWRSALIKILWFMPGIEDKREKGIERLSQVRMSGVYTKTAASVALVDILLNENRYGETLVIAEEMLMKYPTSTLFRWGKARALYGLKRYEEAAGIFRAVLSKLESDPDDNHYTAALCNLYLAKINLYTGRFTQAVAECNRMSHYEFEESVRKRLDKSFSEANSIKKQALSGQVKREGRRSSRAATTD